MINDQSYDHMMITNHRDDDDDDDGNDENGNEGFINKSDLVVQPFFARTFLEGKGV